MSNLKNKNIVVTGGNGLLGAEFVSKLRSDGATVFNLEKNIDSDDFNINCDITNENSVKKAIKNITKKYQKIDGWVNNAYPRTKDWGNKFEDVSYESWKKNIDLQLGSVFLCSKLVVDHMKKNRSGSLLNIASIYGVVAPEFSIYKGTSMTTPAAYSAIKGGVINFSRYLASYYGKYGIRINCVSPGGIFNNQSKTFIKNYISNVPLMRMANPDDISPIVSFLMSNDSKYITGQNIVVDGGWTCK
tara:strand:+ start:3885 stop:4619 length:735 start_codon:yes stop_codon:yes gene_type:complete